MLRSATEDRQDWTGNLAKVKDISLDIKEMIPKPESMSAE